MGVDTVPMREALHVCHCPHRFQNVIGPLEASRLLGLLVVEELAHANSVMRLAEKHLLVKEA